MTKFCTNRNKQTILIESIPYSNWEIEMVRMNIPADNRSFRQELFSFLSEWFDPADTLCWYILQAPLANPRNCM